MAIATDFCCLAAVADGGEVAGFERQYGPWWMEQKPETVKTSNLAPSREISSEMTKNCSKQMAF